MSRVARYAKVTAHQGRGGEVASILLAAAAELAAEPGCELYLINHQADQPDIIWVTELWRNQHELEASIENSRGDDDVEAVMELVQTWEMIELNLLGGKGPAHGR